MSIDKAENYFTGILRRTFKKSKNRRQNKYVVTITIIVI